MNLAFTPSCTSMGGRNGVTVTSGNEDGGIIYCIDFV